MAAYAQLYSSPVWAHLPVLPLTCTDAFHAPRITKTTDREWKKAINFPFQHKYGRTYPYTHQPSPEGALSHATSIKGPAPGRPMLSLESLCWDKMIERQGARDLPQCTVAHTMRYERSILCDKQLFIYFYLKGKGLPQKRTFAENVLTQVIQDVNEFDS